MGGFALQARDGATGTPSNLIRAGLNLQDSRKRIPTSAPLTMAKSNVKEVRAETRGSGAAVDGDQESNERREDDCSVIEERAYISDDSDHGFGADFEGFRLPFPHRFEDADGYPEAHFYVDGSMVPDQLTKRLGTGACGAGVYWKPQGAAYAQAFTGLAFTMPRGDNNDAEGEAIARALEIAHTIAPPGWLVRIFTDSDTMEKQINLVFDGGEPRFAVVRDLKILIQSLGRLEKPVAIEVVKSHKLEDPVEGNEISDALAKAGAYWSKGGASPYRLQYNPDQEVRRRMCIADSRRLRELHVRNLEQNAAVAGRIRSQYRSGESGVTSRSTEPSYYQPDEAVVGKSKRGAVSSLASAFEKKFPPLSRQPNAAQKGATVADATLSGGGEQAPPPGQSHRQIGSDFSERSNASRDLKRKASEEDPHSMASGAPKRMDSYGSSGIDLKLPRQRHQSHSSQSTSKMQNTRYKKSGEYGRSTQGQRGARGGSGANGEELNRTRTKGSGVLGKGSYDARGSAV